MKLKKFFISYRRLKTQKHLVSIGYFCCGLIFMNIFLDKSLKQFFDIENYNMYLSKNILY